jgi:hypothetical protein
MSDSDMVEVHKDDLGYLLAHVADELHGHPDRRHWTLPLLLRAVTRLNYSLGENKLIDLERLTPQQVAAGPHHRDIRLHQEEVRFASDAKRTPSAWRIERLRREIAVWLRTRGYVEVDESTTYLNAEAVGTIDCIREVDGSMFKVDIRGGFLFRKGDNE